MENEELVFQIQRGQTGLYPQLWENVEKFVIMMAKKRYILTNGCGGVEVDDLVQCGFLALVTAVKYYDPSTGYKFITFLDTCLLNEFNTAAGIRTEKQRKDPIHKAKSLDEPLTDDADGDSLIDMIEDPSHFEDDVIESMWLDDLRETLRKAIAEIPEEQGKVIRLKYKEGLSGKEISKEMGIEENIVRQNESKGLRELRNNKLKNGLARFLEDSTPYYRKVGVQTFNTTRTSAVEFLAIRREKITKQYLQGIPVDV